MSKPVKTIWTVTYDLGGSDELELVNPSLLIEDELEVGWRQTTEDADYVEADDSEGLDFGNTKRDFKLTVYRTHASPAAAREYCFAADLAIPRRAQKNLTVAITGGATYVYASCVFTSGRTVPRRGIPNSTATTYELKCGALTLGTPAGPDPIGLGEAAASFSRTEGLLDAGGTAADHAEAAATWTNGGTAGDATQATSGNRPTVIRGSGLYLPGIAGNNYTLSDDASLEPGSNFSLRWDGILPDYTPAARVCLLGKWVTTGNQRSYAMFLETDGKVSLQVSTDGTAGTVTTWTSALPVGIPNGEFVGIQVIKNGTALQFRIFPAHRTWTGALEFSPAQVISNLTPFNSTAALELGSTDGGTAGLMEGFVTGFQLIKAADHSTDSTTVLLDFLGGSSVASSVPAFNRAGLAPLRRIYAYGLVNGEGSYPRFDGTNDNMALATPVKLNAKAGATVIWLGTLNRVSGTNDLVFCGTNSTDPRVLLRVNGGDVQLLVRRLDGEATATITAAAAVAVYHTGSISAVVDYAGGTARIYVNGAAVASGALTSAGTTSATDSSETRIMAGQGGANPAAGDVRHVLILEEATSPFQHAEYLATLEAES
jgi:hypothetical protein